MLADYKEDEVHSKNLSRERWLFDGGMCKWVPSAFFLTPGWDDALLECAAHESQLTVDEQACLG